MPISYTTPAGQVRLLINDTVEASPVFTDDEITAFLAMESDSVKLAAAQALDTIADDEALTSKVITSQDLRTDGASVAVALRERAKQLRTQAGVTIAGGLTARGTFETQAFYPDPALVYP